MSRQRAYQLRKLARGLCVICTRPRVTSTRCETHKAKQLEYGRRHDQKRPHGWDGGKARRQWSSEPRKLRRLDALTERCACGLLLPCDCACGVTKGEGW